jgi:cyclophilin family peptidyl-prolyl cis-trans isomerase
MARSEFEADSASSQFFWLLFESDLTPAGKNLLDGRYSCFGYTTEGNDLLKGVKEGDIIESIKIVKGAENLIAPKS